LFGHAKGGGGAGGRERRRVFGGGRRQPPGRFAMRRWLSGGRSLRSLVVGGLCLWLIAGAVGDGRAMAVPMRDCDEVPTGVDTRDYWLHFKVPPGLMPDRQFDGRPAKLEVHRVSPVYANGKCPGVPNRAAVLIHGRTLTGPPAFDLRLTDPERKAELSLQRALARAGIDTFAPSLLGYGRSTRFDEGLDDPGNASLRAYLADGSCPHPEGCDRSAPPGINPLDQQGDLLIPNPLPARRAHTSTLRFARVDVWVRDIRQVIDDAIARARPADGKVALIGYSAGGGRVGRTLYAANPVLPGSAAYIAKVSRAVFLSSIFRLGPTEEPPAVAAPTFPLTLTTRAGSNGGWAMPAGRDAACGGHVIPGSQDRLWAQMMEHDTLGREWGGGDPAHPAGLNRSPTFSTYGWDDTVAGRLSTPALVFHGLDDTAAPPANATAIYEALPVANKVLVRVQCASHALLWQGCAGPRCTPASGTPYGGTAGAPWAGPHATLKAALIEWIKRGTFNGAASGRFTIDASGVAGADP
jgi:pimeloyl-ACP methyl ester carboxylesterase